jgi:hypothetical protein
VTRETILWRRLRPSRLASALGIATLLVACGSTISHENYSRITNDTAYAEIVKILGEPTSSESREWADRS